jgi:hypothetical protein
MELWRSLWAGGVLGFCEPKVLPPLRDLTADQIKALRETMSDMQFLQEDCSP